MPTTSVPFDCLLLEGILTRIGAAYGLIAGDILDAQELEDLEQRLSIVSERRSAFDFLYHSLLFSPTAAFSFLTALYGRERPQRNTAKDKNAEQK